MIPFSVLDLSPITEGGSVAQSLANSRSLAQHTEALGYRRFWLAEHHNMPGIASAATAVVIGHVAAGTSKILVGAGGIMLPNHAPLVVAEQFGTLAALFPGRIELGLGRAPGTDQNTSRALRRTLDSDPNDFPRDVVELMAYLGDPQPGQTVRAIPGMGSHVPVWILGSSLFGAQLAAMLGLPFAFASHFAPAQMMQAAEIYRSRFEPGVLDKPHLMLGCSAFAADTQEEAELIATSMQQSFVNLRSGRPAPLPPPRAGYLETLDPMARAMLDQTLSCSFVGTTQSITSQIRSFIERTGADELMITCNVYDHAARLRSYTLMAEVRDALAAEAKAA